MKSRLPKGLGGTPNMNNMIKQAQKMQEDMSKAQEELDVKEFKASSGGGAVEVVMLGNKMLKSINIKPEVVDPEDIDMLQDLIIAAINEVSKTVEDVSNKTMESISGGLSIPGVC